MTLKECMTLKEIFPTTIFSVKLMHDCIYLVVTFLTKSTVFEFSSMKARHRSFNRTSFSAADNPPPGSEGFPSPVPPVNTTRARNIGMEMLRLKSILGCDDTLFFKSLHYLFCHHLISRHFLVSVVQLKTLILSLYHHYYEANL